MDNKRTFSKEEISKILTKASKIQARKDLYGDEQGLTEEELLHIAEEVGIDKDSLLKAIQRADLPELDSDFNWLTASSKIQDIHIIDGEISEETWEEVVQDIRRITGGIGKLNRVGKSYEWEQRMKEIGYKHISLAPQKGKTKIQFVSNWKGLKLLTTILPFFFGALLTGIILDGTNLPEFIYILLPALGGLGGIGLGRVYLKRTFEKQKLMFKQIIRAIGKRISPSQKPEISIEEEGVYGDRGRDSSASVKAPRERS